jgi:hypothetical protein
MFHDLHTLYVFSMTERPEAESRPASLRNSATVALVAVTVAVASILRPELVEPLEAVVAAIVAIAAAAHRPHSRQDRGVGPTTSERTARDENANELEEPPPSPTPGT